MGVRGSAKRRRRPAPCSSAGANSKGESRFPPISGGDGHALERKSKQRRAAAPSSSAGPSGAVADLISCLGDDMLVRILELLPDARDAVRTDALSRRWRGLWTRLPTLRFASGIRPEFWAVRNGSQRYVAFVNDAVALRTAQTEPASLQLLAISFTMTSPLQHCFEAAQGWIRDALRNEVKSFVLEIDRPTSNYNFDAGRFDKKVGNTKEQFLVTLEDLPSSAKMETMRLALDGAAVRLPAAATFTALMDLSLENMEFKDGSSSEHLLNRLLSPACCPRLRKLSLRELWFTGLDELLLEAETLLELSMEDLMWEPRILRLRAPSLRALRVAACDNDMLTLSAPKLEKILFLNGLPCSKIDMENCSALGASRLSWSHMHPVTMKT